MTQPTPDVVSPETVPAAPAKKKFPWVIVLLVLSLGLKVMKVEHKREVREAQQVQTQSAEPATH